MVMMKNDNDGNGVLMTVSYVGEGVNGNDNIEDNGE